MATTDDGVTIDLTEFDGSNILLAGLTAIPEVGDFVVLVMRQARIETA